MAFISVQSLIDLRKMRRMTKLVKNDDPDRAADMLADILKQALEIQMTGNIRAQNNAIQELKSLRNAMIAGTINAGKKTSKLIGTFTMASEEMERENKNLMNKIASDNKLDLSTITDNLPSMDSLTSALITANPIAGYSVKIMRDIRKQSKLNREKKLAAEKERQDSITNKISEIMDKVNLSNKDDEEPIQKEPPQILEKQEPDKKEESRLEPIDDEMSSNSKKFYSDLSEGTSNTMKSLWEQFFVPFAAKTDKNLHYIESNTYDMAKSWNESYRRKAYKEDDDAKYMKVLQKMDADQEEEKRRLEKIDQENQAREQEATRNRLEAQKESVSNTSAGFQTEDKKDTDSGLGGFLGGLLGSFAGGLPSMIMGGLSAIAGIFTSIGAIGKLAMSVASKLTPLAVIYSIYEFLDGFFDAGKILGKSTVTLRERIETGIANVIASFAGLLDDLLGIFGLKIFDGSKKDLAKKLSLGLHDMVDTAVKFVNDMWDGIMDFFISIKDEIMKFFQDPKTYLENFFKNVASATIDTASEAGQAIQQMAANSMIPTAQYPGLYRSNTPITAPSMTTPYALTKDSIQTKTTNNTTNNNSTNVTHQTNVTNNNQSQINSTGSPTNSDSSFGRALSRNY